MLAREVPDWWWSGSSLPQMPLPTCSSDGEMVASGNRRKSIKKEQVRLTLRSTCGEAEEENYLRRFFFFYYS